MDDPMRSMFNNVKQRLRIGVYAFSTSAFFFRGLIDACVKADDAIEWAVIQPQGHFRYVFADVLPSDRICYLYDSFMSHYDAVDAKRVRMALDSDGGLIAALFKDKDGYRWLNKDEQLRRGAAMYGVYRAFLEQTRPDFMLFPDIEVVDGFILLNLCLELGIGVLYFTSMRFLGRSYLGPNSNESLPVYFGDYDEADISTAREVIADFYARLSREPAGNYPKTIFPKPSWWRRLVVSSFLRYRYERLHATEDTQWNRIKRNLRKPLYIARRKRFDLLSTHYFDIKDQSAILPDHYVLYALQYTPESSINGLEPYYIDQTRVIDALLLSLPHGHMLVVKEHPAMVGVRSEQFYRTLRRKPGLVLAHPSIDSRWLVERASVVVTVTGTIGLESYLLDKPCVLFGNTFFSHLCHRAPALGELRPFLERLISSYFPATAEQKEREFAKLLHIGGDFLIGDLWFNPSVMAPENIRMARSYLNQHIALLQKSILKPQ